MPTFSVLEILGFVQLALTSFCVGTNMGKQREMIMTLYLFNSRSGHQFSPGYEEAEVGTGCRNRWWWVSDRHARVFPPNRPVVRDCLSYRYY